MCFFVKVGVGAPGVAVVEPLVQLGLYRWGFNSKENDNEVKGEGNQQDYGKRFYDPRVGKFLSVDPITAKYPELTPYQFASNNPIFGIDQDGLEIFPGSGYLVDKLSQGAAQLGMMRTSGFISTYGHSVLLDPVYSAHNVAKTASAGDVAGTAKQFDVTGVTGIPEIYRTGKRAVQGDAYAQGQILGMLPGLYGGFRAARASAGLGVANEVVAGSQAYEPLQRITLKEPTLSTDGALKGYVFNGTPEINGVSAQLHGTFDFVVSDNVLTFGKRHTFLSMGAADVEAAGAFTFKHGKMVTVDNLSGHYFPSIEESMNFLKVLQKQGMNVEHTTLKMYNTSESTGRLQLQKQVAPNAKDRSAFTLSL